jgi:FAD synthetase
MTVVLANGVFDYLHPGHLHYLRKSAALGDELKVVITRDSWPTAKTIRMDEDDRQAVVQALEMVDNAFLGSEDSIYEAVEHADPDIITLGYDQKFDEDELGQGLADNGFDVEIVRIGKKGDYSSSDLKHPA